MVAERLTSLFRFKRAVSTAVDQAHQVFGRAQVLADTLDNTFGLKRTDGRRNDQLGEAKCCELWLTEAGGRVDQQYIETPRSRSGVTIFHLISGLTFDQLQFWRAKFAGCHLYHPVLQS